MKGDKALWEKVYTGQQSSVYINAAKLIGHLGCAIPAFVEASKLLPDFDKCQCENAVRDLTIWEKREKGRLELHQTAKKVLRIILGPQPTDPEYVRWWRSRLVSVEQVKRDGVAVNWAEAPPIPLPDEGPKAEEPKPTKSKKPRPRKKSA